MGPGTRVIANILEGVEPTSYNDALALRHDIEYLKGGEKFRSDLKAIIGSDSSPQGLAMKLGLMSRIGFDLVTHVLPFVNNLHLNKDVGLNDNQYQELKSKARPMLEKYNISLADLD